MSSLLADLRHAMRLIGKDRVFTLVAVLTLALGIGANTAIFSIANAVLFRPLPFRAPERLVMIWEHNPKMFSGEVSATPANFLAWRDESQKIEAIAALSGRVYTLTGAGEAERLSGAEVTHNLFALLGVEAQAGRTFAPDEAAHSAIISHSLWQRRFGANPAIIGRQATLNDQAMTIVGVLPRDFKLPVTAAEVYTPLALTAADSNDRGTHRLDVIARLKPEATIREAEAELQVIAGRVAAQSPPLEGWSISLNSLQSQGVSKARRALLLLLGAVGMVMLVACANVANLSLARAVSRNKELAIRAALGASRFRLARQLMVESALLAAAGALAGLLIAFWAIDLFVAIAPRDIPRLDEASLDARVLAFTLAIATGAALLSGLAPALRASRTDLNEAIKSGGGEMQARHWMRSAIVVAEIALALVLTIGAGLLISSFWRLGSVDPGIRSENVLTLGVPLPFNKYRDDERRAAFYRQLIERVAALPGVEAAAVTLNLPLTRSSYFFFIDVEGYGAGGPSPAVRVEGRATPSAGGEGPLKAEIHAISPDYFRVMGMQLRRGRAFTSQDTSATTPVMIISEAMARRYFGETDPIGKHVRILANRQPPRQIVGVVSDVRHRGLAEEVVDEMYVPGEQFVPTAATIVARATGDPLALIPAVKREVWALDPDQPIGRVATMDGILASSIEAERFNTRLLGLFALVALALAGVGIYGVISYSVSQATREIGIRRALGAQAGDILRLVIGRALLLATIGIALGAAGALALTRFIESLLFQVSATDPLVFAAVASLFFALAAAASYLPARRASRIDPLLALRYE